MTLARRQFIKLGTAATLGIPFLSQCTSATIQNEQSVSELYKTFQNPESKHRVFVRWWWNGDRLSAKEILRELDVMKAAGIGGVEINPIKFPGNADDIGIPSIEWLSDDWLEMLKVALTGAKERGMICDIIVGSGWPFGGEFLTRDEQTQLIALGTQNLQGGKTYQFSKNDLLESVNPDFHSKYENKLKELFMVRLVPKNAQKLDDYIDLSDQVKKDTLTINVPKGEYVMYYLVKITGFMAVINGAPGANGPVLNHYSKPAIEKFLNRMSDRITAKIGPMGDYFRACFTDSMELEGANWCDDLFEQFKQQKGYDLVPYFPYILFKVGEMGNAVKEEYGAAFPDEIQQQIKRVRYDFEEVRVQLFKERFIDTFNTWCKKNGVQSRMQAYGRECNPLEGSMYLDIPECETWLGFSDGKHFSDEDYRDGRAYLMCNKYVSSGARLVGKKLVSCEELTNTSMVFNASLDIIKVSGDQSTLSGVTHSILHGFNYSPLEVPFPGWIRYGTFINERNTWWPYFRYWTDYKARISALLQNAEMQADIAILHPLADLEKNFGFQRDPFPKFAYPTYQHQVWEAIHQNGGGCDYITERIIQQSNVKDGQLTYGPRSYKALILLAVESMNPATANIIQKFGEAGGKVIFVEKVPHLSASLKGTANDDATITETMRNLMKQHAATVGTAAAPVADFVTWYRDLQTKYKLPSFVSIQSPDKFVSQIHYRHADAAIFFFTNYHTQKGHQFEAEFPIKDRTAWIWDAETGKRYRYPTDKKSNTLKITLDPSESKLIVFTTEKERDEYKVPPLRMQAAGLPGVWNVTLQPIEGERKTLALDKLVDFKEREDLKHFAGTITYENTFDGTTKTGNRRYIDLGQVYGVSELELNGKPLGVKWYGRHLYEVTDAIKNGNNALKIKLTTTLGNYMKSLQANKVAQEWTGGQPYYSVGVVGPVTLI